MKIANLYSHLNGYEFLLVHKAKQLKEITSTIESINASDFTKVSKAKPTNGKLFYDQKALNKEIKEKLIALEWEDVRIT